jgi:putative transposase
MSRWGDYWDNAVAESFFSTLKIELAHDADWTLHADARVAVHEYLEIFYNRQRRHPVLGYVSPVAFERQHEEKCAAYSPQPGCPRNPGKLTPDLVPSACAAPVRRSADTARGTPGGCRGERRAMAAGLEPWCGTGTRALPRGLILCDSSSRRLLLKRLW